MEREFSLISSGFELETYRVQQITFNDTDSFSLRGWLLFALVRVLSLDCQPSNAILM